MKHSITYHHCFTQHYTFTCFNKQLHSNHQLLISYFAQFYLIARHCSGKTKLMSSVVLCLYVALSKAAFLTKMQQEYSQSILLQKLTVKEAFYCMSKTEQLPQTQCCTTYFLLHLQHLNLSCNEATEAHPSVFLRCTTRLIGKSPLLFQTCIHLFVNTEGHT